MIQMLAIMEQHRDEIAEALEGLAMSAGIGELR